MKKIKDFDRLKDKYETSAQALIDWAKDKTERLDNRDLPNNLHGIQGEFQVCLFVHDGMYSVADYNSTRIGVVVV